MDIVGLDSVAIAGLPRLAIESIRATLGDRGVQTATPPSVLEWLPQVEGVPGVILGSEDTEPVTAVRQVRPDAIIVWIANQPSTFNHAAGIADGADAVLTLEDSSELIATALAHACEEFTLVPTHVAVELAAHYPHSNIALTEDEADLLRALAEGTGFDELAHNAGYSVRHYRRIVKRVYARLGASNRAEALVRATELGILVSRQLSAKAAEAQLRSHTAPDQ